MISNDSKPVSGPITTAPANDAEVKNVYLQGATNYTDLSAPGILYIGQANALYIFSQQIYLMIFFILARIISVYSSRKYHVLLKVTFFFFIFFSYMVF